MSRVPAVGRVRLKRLSFILICFSLLYSQVGDRLVATLVSSVLDLCENGGGWRRELKLPDEASVNLVTSHGASNNSATAVDPSYGIYLPEITAWTPAD